MKEGREREQKKRKGGLPELGHFDALGPKA